MESLRSDCVRVVLRRQDDPDLGHAKPQSSQHAECDGPRQRRERDQLEQVGDVERVDCRQVGYLIVSGSDDHTFRIWDIRNLR